jgi:alcohol dehydrogenase
VRGSEETPGFWPDLIVYKEVHVVGAFGVDTPAYRAALDLLASGRHPFDSIPRRAAPLAEMDHLLLAMAGEGDPPPLHGVAVP